MPCATCIQLGVYPGKDYIVFETRTICKIAEIVTYRLEVCSAVVLFNAVPLSIVTCGSLECGMLW